MNENGQLYAPDPCGTLDYDGVQEEEIEEEEPKHVLEVWGSKEWHWHV